MAVAANAIAGRPSMLSQTFAGLCTLNSQYRDTTIQIVAPSENRPNLLIGDKDGALCANRSARRIPSAIGSRREKVLYSSAYPGAVLFVKNSKAAVQQLPATSNAPAAYVIIRREHLLTASGHNK